MKDNSVPLKLLTILRTIIELIFICVTANDKKILLTKIL